jgi:hypothetical protein
MIREKIKVGDFDRISKENEFFLWHFYNEESATQINSIFLPSNPFAPNPLPGILDLIHIPYFESDAKESYDFLINISTPFIYHAYRHRTYNPVMIGFNRKRVVNHTFGPYCYCIEGIIDLIGEINPQFIINAS